MTEFEVIERFFCGRSKPAGSGIHLGIGDDCALISPRAGFELAISTDMLVEGRHFVAGADPEALGWKALAVNLSDLAAMAAEPLAFTLALALPAADERWLEAFSRGLFDCADRYHCGLIGGDTTRGPRTLCVTIFGEVPQGSAIRRSGARSGDDIWVSGTLGDAALGLRLLQGNPGGECSESADALRALERPVPRIGLGIDLRGIATSMIDISDGLAGDLGHILERSNRSSGNRCGALGADIEIESLPISRALRSRSERLRLECALAGGDDYELCFTAPPDRKAAVVDAGARAQVAVTRVGSITASGELKLLAGSGDRYRLPQDLSLRSYDHFA